MQFIPRASPRACTRIHVMRRARYTERICAARKYVCAHKRRRKLGRPPIAFCVYTGDKLHVAQAAHSEWSPAEIQKSRKFAGEKKEILNPICFIFIIRVARLSKSIVSAFRHRLRDVTAAVKTQRNVRIIRH